MITIDPFSRVPIYEQVIHRIAQLVMVGDLKKGDKLPSVRVLARDLGVNPNTIQKAYTDLERSHIINTVTGKGNFIGEHEAVAREVGERLLDHVREAASAARSNRIPYQAIIGVVDLVYKEENGGKEPVQ